MNISIAQDSFANGPPVRLSHPSLWREAAWAVDWIKLRVSPVYLGFGVPHGHGEPVLLLPGFLSGDVPMLELYLWLKRIGYRAYLSDIVLNHDCPDTTARKLATRVQELQRRSGMKIRVIGHSLGGLLAKNLSHEHPDLIDRIITLGSPFRSLGPVHPAVVRIWEHLQRTRKPSTQRRSDVACGSCDCGFIRNLQAAPKPAVPHFAIYSKKDAITDWRNCAEEDPQRNSEVNCTHIGMIYHPEVYRAIGQRLVQDISPKNTAE